MIEDMPHNTDIRKEKNIKQLEMAKKRWKLIKNIILALRNVKKIVSTILHFVFLNIFVLVIFKCFGFYIEIIFNSRD